MNESKRKRIKRAAVSWLCVAALAASAVPPELTGIITPISVFAASEPDPIDFVGTIDLSKLMDYKSSPASCPAGITASLVGDSSNEYDRSVVLTISQNGSYKLIGSNCINGSYVDVQIKITDNAKVTLVCDDAYVKNDKGSYERYSCGYSVRDYVIPFKAEDDSQLTVSGKLYVDTYSYPYYLYSSPLNEGNVTLSSFEVYCYYPDRVQYGDYDKNYALSGYEYDLRDYTPKYKCLIDFSDSRIGKISSEAKVKFFDEHDLDENHKCNRCGIHTHTITYVIGSASQITDTVDDQSLLKKPAVPTNGTKTFTGWYTDESCTTLYDFSTPVTEDLTLYAGWFTPVIFNGVTYDKPLNKNTVKYFYTDNSGNIVLDTGNYILTEDMVFDNDISLKAGSNVNLFLNGHELSAGIDSSSAAGFVIVNDENTPGKLLTKTDSADNWTLPIDYTISDNTDSATKITFPYALCHTRVDFEMNGHGTQIDSLKPTNKAVTKPTDPTESGWTFGGWYSDADLKTPFDFDNITDICTAYAQWTEYAVEEIAVKTPPTKTEYYEGDSFDPAGLVLTLTYDNGETADVAYSTDNASEFKFSPDGELALTDTSVTITYGGKTAAQKITVSENTLASIAVSSAPKKTSYIEGESFDPAGLVLTLTYDSGKTENVAYSTDNASEFTFSPDGELALTDSSVTITYGGKSTAQKITVREKAIVSVSVATAPKKTSYIEGEIFDPTGLVLTLTYDNGKTTDVAYSTDNASEFTFSPDGELALTDTSVTITYGGKTAAQKITVSENTLASIAVSSAPKKTSYIEGENFDPTGLVLTLTYDNGKTTDVAYSTDNASEFTFSPDGEFALTDSSVTITYGGKSAAQKITVSEKSLVSVVVSSAPKKTSYIEGESFDPTGLVLTLTYDNGKTENVAYSTDNASEFKFSPDGELALTDTSVTITYGGKSTAQKITVREKAIVSVSVATAPKKTSYTSGESFDPAGLVLTLTYDNGKTENVAYSAENASEFTFSPDGALTVTDTFVTITYSGKAVTIAVTVSKGVVIIEPSDDNEGNAVIDMPINELMDAILNDEDKKLIDKGVNIAVLMATVTIDPEIVPETDKQAIDDVLNDFSIGCYLDVNLFKRYSNGDPDKKVTDPSSAITISFEVPQYILDKYPKDEYVYSVFCSHNGVGYPVKSNFDPATNIMTFSSDKFSIYALGVMPEEVEEEYNIKSDSHIKVVNSAKEGETVTVIVDEGYKAVVTDAKGNVITEITGTGTFTMPASDVTITAEKISKPDPVKYYSIYTDSHVWVDSTKHKEGDTVNYRVDNFYEAVLYVNGAASSKLSGSGSFTMPAADVKIVSGMDEITYAMFTTSVENSYVYSYDTDMNLIKTSGTRKKNNYVIIDLGEEYAGRSITIYKGRKSTKTIITEGVLDKNGIFKFENAGFGTNYTLIIGD